MRCGGAHGTEAGAWRWWTEGEDVLKAEERWDMRQGLGESSVRNAEKFGVRGSIEDEEIR